jgi:hypothetical protein
LRGANDTSFLTLTANENIRQLIGHVRYVITADADTVLPPGTAARLIGTISHPLNQAKFDPVADKSFRGIPFFNPESTSTHAVPIRPGSPEFSLAIPALIFTAVQCLMFTRMFLARAYMWVKVSTI